MTTQEKILKLAKSKKEIRIRIGRDFWIKVNKSDAIKFIKKYTNAIVHYDTFHTVNTLYIETDKRK